MKSNITFLCHSTRVDYIIQITRQWMFCFYIKDIFDSINMQQVYITKSLYNIATFETKCKELNEYQWLELLTS